MLYNPHVSGEPPWLHAVGRIFNGIPDLATPPEVQGSLREILGDPELEMFWWDWEAECYVDVHGAAAEVEKRSGSRALTLVAYEARKVGALLHDPRLLDHPEFLSAFVPTMRIAMERDRLHRDLVQKLEELRASRLRMVTAGDEERRRLERNLHDGAQQRLVVALLTLRRLEHRLEQEGTAPPELSSARQDLENAIDDLRELARGLHPPLLARRGLAAAIRAASARGSTPGALAPHVGEGLPPAVEAAAYYVCAEAVTNTVKHARASRVWIRVEQQNGGLQVDVRDDGVGGACIDCDQESSGLGGLVDRVEALEGTIELTSPPGEGTRLLATFPVG
jgi:signal transduction histidine kinase